MENYWFINLMVVTLIAMNSERDYPVSDIILETGETWKGVRQKVVKRRH